METSISILFYSIQSGSGKKKQLVFVFISAARASLSTTFKMFDLDDEVVFLPIVAFRPSRMLFFLVCKIFGMSGSQ